MDGRPWYEDQAETSSPHPPKRQKNFHDEGNEVHESRNGSLTSHDQYTIAWICALHIEMAAARAMLDEVHEDLPRHRNNSNTYTLGSIEYHNIVIACLPTYGTNNAANVLTHLVRTFPSIRLGLMVGIGGGVPSNADIRLGDIVVGTRVMQYDLGKIVGDGQIQPTAIPKIPQQLLGTVVSTLRSKHELEPSRVPSILREKFEGHSEYGRPSSPDCLFCATYDHASPTPGCDGCDHSKLVPRSRRMTDDPLIHYGAIASGNQVIRSGTVRDNIARRADVMCFEMEAAGLMDILPYLPIRGICNYSDSHKNKEWQKYAAAAAAAYARELLTVLPVAEAHAKAAHVPNPHQDLSNNHRQRLLDSLRFDQMDSRKSTIKTAHIKTCRWFLNHPDYQAWLDAGKWTQHHGFLWISGKPGAGKSTIMKFACSSMKSKARREHSITASFFFNARGEYLERSIVGMYRSLLLQLLEDYPDLQTVLDDPDLVSPSQNGCPCLNVLKDLFCNAVSALGKLSFTCFIDALDECDEQQVMDMVQYFEDLAEQSTDNRIALRICFSSRHYPYIIIRRGIRLTLEDQPGHAEDLANYVASRLRIKEPALVEELQPQLLEKAAGVFLWIVLVVDILNKDYGHGGLAPRKRLAEIPSDLSKLFRNILRRDNKNMEHLLLCVLWILYAKQPLRPTEFYHALWSGLSLKGLADPEIPGVTVPDAGDRVNGCVISSSKGLAEITKSKQPTVQFIHESVRDFLVKDKGLHELWPDLGFDWESPSHERLKQCCNLYMNHSLVRASVSKLLSEAKSNGHTEISKEYPFLEYASQHVLHHANAAANAVPQDEFLSRFRVPNWISIINLFEKFKVREYSPDASLFYLLAEKGFSELIRTRLKKDPRIHCFGERYGYPIFAALASGNKDAVAALLNSPSSICNGVDITEGLNCRKDLKEYKNRTPLSWAAQDGRAGIVKLLLQTGTTVNEVDWGGRTSLSLASENGHEAVARVLIEKGANANASDKDGLTPLEWALNNGHEAVAGLLIEKGADVNDSDKDGWTPLWWALRNGHEAVAGLLIDKGADVNASDKYGWTPLEWALRNGHEAVAGLLIDKGADAA
ncbi:Pfs, NACHT and ankyrin domain protein [Ilyonectria destructans]|nr:Pfs, NACHT and ankyrin domain protein [Ilyonectria destructans]